MEKKTTILALVLMAAASTLFAMAKPVKEKATDKIDPTGVYTLVTVDGVKIPGTVSHDGHDLMLYSGVFTINANGTCISKTVFTPPSGEKIERQVKATYTQKGSKLNMKWIGAGQTTGTIEGDAFTMDNHGMIFVYKKQP